MAASLGLETPCDPPVRLALYATEPTKQQAQKQTLVGTGCFRKSPLCSGY